MDFYGYIHGLLAKSCLTLARLLCPWDISGKNTGVGCHAFLQGIFPDPGIKPSSLTSPALTGSFFTTSVTWEAQYVG